MGGKLTFREMREAFEDTDNYLKFELIAEEDRLHPMMDLCGLLKVAEIFPTEDRVVQAAEHDMIYLAGYLNGDDDDESPLTMDDVVYLTRCGIRYDTETDCLYKFV